MVDEPSDRQVPVPGRGVMPVRGPSHPAIAEDVQGQGPILAGESIDADRLAAGGEEPAVRGGGQFVLLGRGAVENSSFPFVVSCSANPQSVGKGCARE
jgi:hypothetical protein